MEGGGASPFPRYASGRENFVVGDGWADPLAGSPWRLGGFDSGRGCIIFLSG